MTSEAKKVIVKLGHGAFMRKKMATGECEVELMNPDKSTEQIDYAVYHEIRNKGFGEMIATPSKYAAGDAGGMFSGIPGHDEYYYFGLNLKGKELFYELQKGKL